MRFGKTFAAYQLAKKMGWRKVLVLTFKPAVQSAWEEDLKCHVDFKGWQFIKPGGLTYEEADKKKPFVCFRLVSGLSGPEPQHRRHQDQERMGSCDQLGLRDSGRIPLRRLAGERQGTCSRRRMRRKSSSPRAKACEEFDEDIMPITTDGYLYLSGTPFRAIASGEFIEEQIFNWTYSDEQRAKRDWKGANNPYAALPRMVLLTYQLPDAIREIAMQGEFNEFDLNVFFSAEGIGDKAKFKYEDEVQKWLDLIRGAFRPTSVDNLKLGAQKPPMPFSDARLVECAFAHLLVSAQRGRLPRHAQPAGEESKTASITTTKSSWRPAAPPASARRRCRRCWRPWTIR